MKRWFLPLLTSLALLLIHSASIANPTGTRPIRIMGLQAASHISPGPEIKNVRYYIQVGAFGSLSNAQRLHHRISSQSAFPVKLIQHGRLHVVIIGPIPNRRAVLSLSHRLLGRSIPQQARHRTTVIEKTTVPLVKKQENIRPFVNPPTHVPAPYDDRGEFTSKNINIDANSPRNKQHGKFNPYFSLNGLFGKQEIETITSQEVIVGPLRVAPMNPFNIGEDKPGISIAGGNTWVFDKFKLRSELQYNYHGEISGSINPAFPPPIAGPAVANSFQTSVKAHSGFINAFIQSNDYKNFAAYVGGGVGVANKKARSTMSISAPPLPASNTQSVSTTNIAWQFGVGALYQLTEKIALNLAIMHMNLGEVDYGTFYASAPSIAGRHVRSKNWTANNVAFGIVVNPELWQ